MRPHPIAEVFRIVVLDDPVLIAPHGRDFHDPQVILRNWTGAIGWLDRPVCKAAAERYVAVDRALAELLDRQPCAVCAAYTAPGQTIKITDAEIPAPEPSPESPGSDTKGNQ